VREETQPAAGEALISKEYEARDSICLLANLQTPRTFGPSLKQQMTSAFIYQNLMRRQGGSVPDIQPQVQVSPDFNRKSKTLHSRNARRHARIPRPQRVESGRTFLFSAVSDQRSLALISGLIRVHLWLKTSGFSVISDVSVPSGAGLNPFSACLSAKSLINRLA
jgi:hypothetical protein